MKKRVRQQSQIREVYPAGYVVRPGSFVSVSR